MNSKNHLRLSLAILTGGRSTRFGAEKGMALLRGKTLARHVYDAAIPLVGEVLLSTGFSSQMPVLPDSRPVQDAYTDAGPLSGILACLRATLNTTPNPWLLVIACDLPLITTQTLERLIEQCRSPNEVVLCQTEEGQAQPLCACYNVSLIEALDAALGDERYGVQRFVETLSHVVRINVPAEELVNINTMEELRRV